MRNGKSIGVSLRLGLRRAELPEIPVNVRDIVPRDSLRGEHVIDPASEIVKDFLRDAQSASSSLSAFFYPFV